MKNKVKFIQGGISIDDRGELIFCNNFKMDEIKRFYQVSNHNSNFVRAWHAHKFESKYVFVHTGTAVFAAVKIDDWDNPDKNSDIDRIVLTEKKPGLLFIPAGFAHGYKTIVSDTKIIFFSNKLLDKSISDDYRYDSYYWNPWEIVER